MAPARADGKICYIEIPCSCWKRHRHGKGFRGRGITGANTRPAEPCTRGIRRLANARRAQLLELPIRARARSPNTGRAMSSLSRQSTDS